MALEILIADDDRRLPGELRRLLERGGGIRVTEARDGEEAIGLALAGHPDLVLMDIVMPGLGGLEATRRIKAACPGVKIVTLTVHDEVQYRSAARESGADSLLLKKKLGAELIPAIRDLIPTFPAPDAGPLEQSRSAPSR